MAAFILVSKKNNIDEKFLHPILNSSLVTTERLWQVDEHLPLELTTLPISPMKSFDEP